MPVHQQYSEQGALERLQGLRLVVLGLHSPQAWALSPLEHMLRQIIQRAPICHHERQILGRRNCNNI